MYMYAFHSDNFVPLVFRPVLILINVHKVVEVEGGEQGRVGWGPTCWGETARRPLPYVLVAFHYFIQMDGWRTSGPPHTHKFLDSHNTSVLSMDKANTRTQGAAETLL